MKTLYEGILNDFDTALKNNDAAIRETMLLKHYFGFSTTYAAPYQLYIIDRQALKHATKNMTNSIDGRYKFMDNSLRELVTWIENINIYDLGLDSNSIYKKEAGDILTKKLKRKIQTFFKLKLIDIQFDVSDNRNLWFSWKFEEIDGEKRQVMSSILFDKKYKI